MMFILPLMTDHLFWKATFLGGLYRGVLLYLISYLMLHRFQQFNCYMPCYIAMLCSSCQILERSDDTNSYSRNFKRTHDKSLSILIRSQGGSFFQWDSTLWRIVRYGRKKEKNSSSCCKLKKSNGLRNTPSIPHMTLKSKSSVFSLWNNEEPWLVEYVFHQWCLSGLISRAKMMASMRRGKYSGGFLSMTMPSRGWE